MTHSATIPVDRDEALHLRPMQALVERAVDFDATLTIARGGKSANAKSIFDVMMLAAEKGPLELRAEGADAEEAVRTLVRVLTAELKKG